MFTINCGFTVKYQNEDNSYRLKRICICVILILCSKDRSYLYTDRTSLDFCTLPSSLQFTLNHNFSILVQKRTESELSCITSVWKRLLDTSPRFLRDSALEIEKEEHGIGVICSVPQPLVSSLSTTTFSTCLSFAILVWNVGMITASTVELLVG